MNWSLLLANYGYWAVFVGAFFEGETVMLLGAYAVHQHFLQLWPLILTGAAGGFVGDQFYYLLGRHGGRPWLDKRPKLLRQFNRTSSFIDAHPLITIILMRFAWGLRTILPVSFGIKAYSHWRYTLVNALACMLWSTTIVLLGVKASVYVHQWLGDIKPYKHVLLGLMAALATAMLVYHLCRKR